VATLIGLKTAINSHAGVAGETPLKRGRGLKGKEMEKIIRGDGSGDDIFGLKN